jgi:general secretion pathway protein D
MIKSKRRGILITLLLFLGLTLATNANECNGKLFSATLDSKLTIGDVVENIADTCGLSVVIRDEAAKKKMNQNLYYVNLNNTTLRGFLNTVLADNDLHYVLDGKKLNISYLITKTFRIHYISGKRIGKSNAHVTIANSNNAAASGSGGEGGATSKTGISIESNDEFVFWKTVEKELQRILIGASDGSTHYTKTSENSWVGPDGQIWEYNPVAPIINPEAGMVTVTGTADQINRASQYIDTLKDQIKQQVMIDVRILGVSFDNSRTTGIDWSQIYNLQNLTISSLLDVRHNISSLTNEIGSGITEWNSSRSFGNGNGQALIATGSVEVADIVKFLGTQGNVKSISSPRVMALNNQPALISVGKELFYKIKSSTTSSSGGGSTSSEGELVDSVFAGILLDITPEIDEMTGMVTLKINPSVSDTVETLSGSSGTRTIPPDLIRRQIASVIKVKDGQHAILGGLITTKNGTTSNKVPLLGDIPGLKYLFSRDQKIETVEELVIVITPHIVKNAKDVDMKDLGYTKLNEK